MAVNLIQAPLPVHFSKNAIDVEFSCPDKFTTLGKYGILLMQLSTYPSTDGNTLKIEFQKDGESFEQTFTFKTTPTEEYEILKYNSTSAWIQDYLIPGLLAWPQLALNFIVGFLSGDGQTGVRFQALFYDNNMMTITPTGFNVTPAVITAGAVPVTQEYYRLSAWLYIGAHTNALANFHRTGEIELDADREAKARINLQVYADAYFDKIEPPTDNLTGPVLCTETNKPAYILYGQRYGANFERKPNRRSNIFRILKGGTHPRFYPTIKNDLVGYYAGLGLTMRKHRTLKRTRQKDWYTWLAPVNTKSLKLEAMVYTINNTSSPSIIWAEKTVDAHRTYQFRIDPEIFDFLADNVTHYELTLHYIVGAQNYTLYVGTIYLDDTYLDRVFYFENTYGAIESICFRGNSSIKAVPSKANYEKPLPFNADASHEQFGTYAEEITYSIACHTGALTRPEAFAFADFLRSRYVRYIEGNKTIPARIIDKDAILDSLNTAADYSRGVDFVAEISRSAGISSGLH